MSLLIVIVNYRSAALAIDCLASLEAEVAGSPIAARAVVVENASGDDSAAVLAAGIRDRGWSSWASLVEAPRNGGFAAGNNVAIGPALRAPDPPALIWLLNPDTVVRPGALAALVAFFDRHPEAGLAGSRLEHPDGEPQGSTFAFPTLLGEVDGGLRFGPVTRLIRRGPGGFPPVTAETPVEWAAGASLMIRRAVFESIGLLDEGYFMYFEEVDFCLRAARAGWPCWYVPTSRVVHLVGQSSGVTRAGQARRRRPRYWFDARRRYYLSNHGRGTAFAANVLHLAAYTLFRVRQLVTFRPNDEPRLMLWDFFRYNFLPVKR